MNLSHTPLIALGQRACRDTDNFQINKRSIEWSYNFSTARKILPLLDLLAKFRRVLACSCSQNFAIARMLGFSLTLFDFLKFRKSCKTGYVRTEDTSIVNSSDLQLYRRGKGMQHQGNLNFKNSLGFGMWNNRKVTVLDRRTVTNQRVN